MAELRLRVLAAGDRNDIAAASAATSTGAWLAQHTRQTRGTAHAQVKLALALDTGYTGDPRRARGGTCGSWSRRR